MVDISWKVYYTYVRNRGVAQFGRALRSGRRGRVFESRRLDFLRPDGQAVKTTPSHGVNPGSIPGQVTDGMVVALQQPFFIFMDIDLHLKFNSCMLP